MPEPIETPIDPKSLFERGTPEEEDARHAARVTRAKERKKAKEEKRGEAPDAG